MKDAQTHSRKIIIKRILQWLFLLVIVTTFACGDDTTGCKCYQGSGKNECSLGQTEIHIFPNQEEGGILDEKNTSQKVVSSNANFRCGAHYAIYYTWVDKTQVDAKNRPPVTVKLGTVKDGVLKDLTIYHDNEFNGEYWKLSKGRAGDGTDIPQAKVKKSDQLILQVKLDQPALKLSFWKLPTLSLPFIGPVIGKPAPAVRVWGELVYSKPSY